MRFPAALACALYLGAAYASPAAIDPKKAADPKDDDPSKQLPAELTLEEFDKIASEQLTFVEFYSPYCSHCKQFAPTWKKAYFLTEEDQKTLNVAMRQVNCVERGDLCHREDVNAYPMLRLYGPTKDDKGNKKPKFIDSFPRWLTRTPENIRKYLINSVAEFNADAIDIPSSTEILDIDSGVKIVAGEMEDPYFVALFSSSNEQYTLLKFPESCLDCVEHRLTLDKVSNLVVSVAKTGVINCHSHGVLCEQLGFPELTQPDLLLAPQYVMFVPKDAGLIRFDYTGDGSAADMKHFISKLSANSKYEEATARDLEDMGVLLAELPTKPTDLYYPLSNKMSLVFLYDKKTVTKEDKAIMPYLLEMVTKLPFEIGLFASKSVKFEQTISDQAHGLLELVNSDKTFTTRHFDAHMHLATTLTAKPTLYIFKENSLIPAVFQNFAIEDMRMPEKIESFIKKNMFPLYGELTPKVFPYYFEKPDKKKKTDNDKVVVTFLDTSNANHIKETLFNLSMVAHQYTLEKKEYYFKDLLEARDAKRERVAKLKAKNADTATVIQEMRTLIPHLFDHDDVLFTYVDMQLYPNFADEYGLNIDGKGYKPGDTIVVSKDRTLYWDQDLSGNPLKADVVELRNLLKYLLNPALVTKEARITSKLVGSPFHHTLRLFDFVHQLGFLGYLLMFGAVFAVYSATKLRFRRRNGGARRGIIGNPLEKSD